MRKLKEFDGALQDARKLENPRSRGGFLEIGPSMSTDKAALNFSSN